MAKQIRLSKLLSCLLALSLVFSLAVPAFAADPAAPSAAPSRQILIVDGKEVEMTVKVGDHVITSKYAGTQVKIDGEELTIVRQGDILAVVE